MNLPPGVVHHGNGRYTWELEKVPATGNETYTFESMKDETKLPFVVIPVFRKLAYNDNSEKRDATPAEIQMWRALSLLTQERDRMREALEEAKLQIEYLHGKFKETGTGNAVLAKINAALKG